MPSPTPPDPDTIRNEARNILGGAEFDHRRHWWDGVVNAVTDPVGTARLAYFWFLEHFPAGSAGAVVAWCLAGLAVTVAVLLVLRLTRTVTRDAAAPVRYA